MSEEKLGKLQKTKLKMSREVMAPVNQFIIVYYQSLVCATILEVYVYTPWAIKIVPFDIRS